MFLTHVQGFLFGRLKYPYAQLQVHVPRVFEILKRAYFNRTKKQYREGLAAINDVDELHQMWVTWSYHSYSRSALGLVTARILELDPETP